MRALLALPWAHPALAALATGGKPMRDCTIRDAATIDALRRGDKRLAIVVGSFEPRGTPAAIVVRLVREDGRREELARFALHPPRALAPGAAPQRFLLSLSDHASRIDAARPLCIEAGFATAKGTVASASADLRVEVVDLPGAPR